jgi:hypothetical protein
LAKARSYAAGCAGCVPRCAVHNYGACDAVGPVCLHSPTNQPADTCVCSACSTCCDLLVRFYWCLIVLKREERVSCAKSSAPISQMLSVTHMVLPQPGGCDQMGGRRHGVCHPSADVDRTRSHAAIRCEQAIIPKPLRCDRYIPRHSAQLRCRKPLTGIAEMSVYARGLSVTWQYGLFGSAPALACGHMLLVYPLTP